MLYLSLDLGITALLKCNIASAIQINKVQIVSTLYCQRFFILHFLLKGNLLYCMNNMNHHVLVPT